MDLKPELLRGVYAYGYVLTCMIDRLSSGG